MTRHRCPAHCSSCMSISRREFVTATTAAMVSTSLLRLSVAGPSPAAASRDAPMRPGIPVHTDSESLFRTPQR